MRGAGSLVAAEVRLFGAEGSSHAVVVGEDDTGAFPMDWEGIGFHAWGIGLDGVKYTLTDLYSCSPVLTDALRG